VVPPGQDGRGDDSVAVTDVILLLGDRYGWRPLPPRISTDIYRSLQRSMPRDDRRIVDEWYRSDANAVPPVYYLRGSTQGDLFDEVEPRLRALLTRAAHSTWPDPEDLRRRTRDTSITEQEVRRGLFDIPGPAEHTYCSLEARFLRLGRSVAGRVLMVAHSKRGER
jgi:hypothetical protein